ncbi:MAG: HD domain-containing protein [Candidatus Heimdallarchaeota archaeon]|nr:HD domain-containing protein [Candidatus Heimdallarchaeota archaeon]
MSEILSFIFEAMRLKRLPRSGWIFSGVAMSEVESVADHSFFVTMITLIIALAEQQKQEQEQTINLEKALIMALLHDLAEGVSQDIDRRVKEFAPKSYQEFKKELDENATKEILQKLPTILTEQLSTYYDEYRKQETIEAKIVAEADRLETLIQLVNYTRLGYPKTLFRKFYEFLRQEQKSYKIPLIKDIAKQLLEGEEKL